MSGDHDCWYTLRSYKCQVCGKDLRPCLSPDCEQDKHAACSGDAWDQDADVPVVCECDCHEPKP